MIAQDSTNLIIMLRGRLTREKSTLLVDKLSEE